MKMFFSIDIALRDKEKWRHDLFEYGAGCLNAIIIAQKIGVALKRVKEEEMITHFCH